MQGLKSTKSEGKKAVQGQGQLGSQQGLPAELLLSNGSNNERRSSLKEGIAKYRKDGQVFTELDNMGEECPEIDEMDMLRTTCYGFK